MKKLIAVLSVLAVVSPVFAQDATTQHRQEKMVQKIEKYEKVPTQTIESLSEMYQAQGTSLQAVLEREQEKANTGEMIMVSEEGALERAIKMVKETVKAFGDFQKAAYTHQYYEYDVMFQLMDNLRDSYMEMREKDKEVARVAASKIYSTRIEIANGDRQITIGDYIRMEVVNLMPMEQEKFEAFLQALEEDMNK